MQLSCSARRNENVISSFRVVHIWFCTQPVTSAMQGSARPCSASMQYGPTAEKLQTFLAAHRPSSPSSRSRPSTPSSPPAPVQQLSICTVSCCGLAPLALSDQQQAAAHTIKIMCNHCVRPLALHVGMSISSGMLINTDPEPSCSLLRTAFEASFLQTEP